MARRSLRRALVSCVAVSTLYSTPGVYRQATAQQYPTPQDPTQKVETGQDETRLADKQPSGSPLGLERVLDSVSRHHPKIRMAALKVEAARGKQTSALGAFDLVFEGALQTAPLGKFDREMGKATLTQQLPYLGAALGGGYRNGRDFEIYNGKSVTARGGEWGIWATLPLLRNRAIDDFRLKRRNADLATQRQEEMLTGVTLDTRLKAAATYFKWVANGKKMHIAAQLLELAEMRQSAVEAQIERGKLAPIEEVDNRRLIFDRRSNLVAAKQVFAQGALALSLFLRDDEGIPVVVDEEALPALDPEPSEPPLVDVQRALTARPELRALSQTIEAAQNRLQAARNRLLPTADLSGDVYKDQGTPRPYGPSLDTVEKTEALISLKFKLPVQRRKAKGQVAYEQATLSALEAERVLMRQQIKAGIDQAVVALGATLQRANLGVEAERAALRMAEAERRMFDEGKSDLLKVNLRELSAASAAAKRIQAWAEHEMAVVTLKAALADL